jgi:hypothetical protein
MNHDNTNSDQVAKLRRLATVWVLTLWFAGVASARMDAKKMAIATLSSRPAMISGGDVLVQIKGSGDAIATDISVLLNGRDVSRAFRLSPRTLTLIGLVDGLELGRNELEIKTGGKLKARLELRNHPVTGPIFSGHHQSPFICQSEAAGLGAPLDGDCSAKTVITYLYKSTQELTPPELAVTQTPSDIPAGFKPFDPSAPRPSDLAQVRTTEGNEVDYIVRRERGTLNRAIYEIAYLHEPGKPLPDPWTATAGWNGRLVFNFGGGCNAGYHQGLPLVGAVDDIFLSRGYAVAASSLNLFANSCDDVISAETMMMVKQYFIKRFGIPVHTIGWGASGGSMQQYLIAQNYPGLLDGIIPALSFPDLVTLVAGIADCSLLNDAFDATKQPWTVEQKTAVSGYASWGTCAENSKGNSWMKAGYSHGLIMPTACNVSIPKALIYDPVSSPQGARCDVYDNAI